MSISRASNGETWNDYGIRLDWYHLNVFFNIRIVKNLYITNNTSKENLLYSALTSSESQNEKFLISSNLSAMLRMIFNLHQSTCSKFMVVSKLFFLKLFHTTCKSDIQLKLFASMFKIGNVWFCMKWWHLYLNGFIFFLF